MIRLLSHTLQSCRPMPEVTLATVRHSFCAIIAVMGKQNEEKKATSEKPVSLNPLKFRDALVNLLAVKPKPEEESEDKRTGDEHDKEKT